MKRFEWKLFLNGNKFSYFASPPPASWCHMKITHYKELKCKLVNCNIQRKAFGLNDLVVYDYYVHQMYDGI